MLQMILNINSFPKAGSSGLPPITVQPRNMEQKSKILKTYLYRSDIHIFISNNEITGPRPVVLYIHL